MHKVYHTSQVSMAALVWANEPTGEFDSETANEIMDVLVNLNPER